VRIAVREEIPEDSELRRAWNDLAMRMEHPEVFYTYEWAIAVQRAYGQTLRPLLFLGYEDELLVGLVALVSETTESRVSFLTANTGDYCDFISEPGRRREFVEAVFSELRSRNIERIVLTNLPRDSSSVVAISGAASSRKFHLHSRQAYLCARVVPGSVDERAALKQVVGSKKRLRRNTRELEKLGKVRVQHDTQWGQIEPVLQTFTRAHIARFLATRRISNLIRPERRSFLSELARELSQSGWVTVSRLLVGEVPAAWNYGFRFAGSWFWYQPTVNSIYGELSPGYCLLAKIVQQACDSPEINVVDLGLGAEDDKDRFATTNQQTLYVVLNRSLLDHFRARVRDEVSVAVRKSPRIENGIRLVLSWTGRIQARIRESGISALLRWFSQRTWNALFGLDEVLFFDWPATEEKRKEPTRSVLRSLDSDILGAAAICYEHDPQALEYLMRSAQRLGSEADRGFALLTADGMPVHFCWAKDFEGFEMAELDRTLNAPSPDAVMIFDCYTPASARGNGFFAAAIAKLANQLRTEGNPPWIFGAAKNRASLRGIQESGFRHKFTLGRRRLLFFKTAKGSVPSLNPATTSMSVSAP
jgi:CelD/BcsL family acetyltransferase involved in cellulose biosynthesis